jgi:hypothetical protein
VKGRQRDGGAETGCSDQEEATKGPKWDVLGVILHNSSEAFNPHVLQVVRITANKPKMDRTKR